MKKKILFVALLSVVAQNAVGGIVDFTGDASVSNPQAFLVRTFGDDTLTVSTDHQNTLVLTSANEDRRFESELPGNITNLYRTHGPQPVIVAQVEDPVSRHLYQVYIKGEDHISRNLSISPVLATVRGNFVVQQREIGASLPNQLAFYQLEPTEKHDPFLVVDHR